MLEARIIDMIDEELYTVPHLRVGITDRKFPTIIAYALIEENGQPLKTLSVCGNPDGYFFNKSALIWRNYVAVGAGHQITLVNLTTQESTTTDLGCYFGYLYSTDEFLLVASAEDLHCFNVNGKLHWVSGMLGADGVRVDKISDGIIDCWGEIDPPGGWVPYKLSLSTGNRL